MKKLLALLLTLSTVLTFGGCCASNAKLYEQAQLTLGEEDYDTAARIFGQLGEYRDAADYALYARGLEALAAGELALARTTLNEVSYFKSADRYLRYLDAEQLSADGHLEEAMDAFLALGAFYRSQERIAELRNAQRLQLLAQAGKLLEDGDIDGARDLAMPYAGTDEADELLARCRSAEEAEAYRAAMSLYNEQRYADALDAFAALGATLDAPVRLQLCKSALYREAEAAYPSVTLADSGRLMEDYARLSGYMGADDRYRALEATFGTRLQLLAQAESHPLVVWGQNASENGDGTAVLWRVLQADAESARLLCCSVLTSDVPATATDLSLDLSVPAMPVTPVMSAPELTADDASLIARAEDDTALLAALTDDDSLAAHWLSALGAEPQASLSGCIPEEGGVRPVVTVPMSHWTLTEGSGTPEDPFR